MVIVKITFSWEVTQCSLVDIYLHLQDLLNREVGGKYPFYTSVNIYQKVYLILFASWNVTATSTDRESKLDLRPFWFILSLLEERQMLVM